MTLFWLTLAPALAPPQHANGWGWDEFACLGLIAIVLVIATFAARASRQAQPNAKPSADADQRHNALE